MRPAFTLVEVLAAAIIATIAGIALLQMNSQNVFLFSRLTGTASVSETLSLVGNHADSRFNRTTKSLYDLLDNTYEIKNDELRKYLQEQRYDYSEQVISTVSFDSDAMPEAGESFTADEMQNVASAPVIQFELLQVIIKTEGQSGAVLIARPF